MNLEQELQRALSRQRPDEGFAERVLARRKTSFSSSGRAEARPTWMRVAASLTLLLALGGVTAQRIAEQRRGERARKQVLIALHIASSKVRLAQREVHRIAHE